MKLGSIIVLIILMVVFFLGLAGTNLFSSVGKAALRKKESIKEKATEEYKHDK
ncbi:hypothetical protein [Cytobacillus oceanisediminis]|uniref:hypothetical protein n=1 Tax=Cytobacillus oceanisediminis TaxID=665099 RepID=UPI001C248276|nr:hypothetical protein [Cytobacillus oceanisediminis]MBU8772159.1 hypothetical protein [Cytobacillus oceanisediminis]